MKKLLITFLLLLIVFNARAENDKIRLRIKKADGNTELISGKLLAIDYKSWRLHLEFSPTETRWLNFTDIDIRSSTTMYKTLEEYAQNDPEKLFEVARYMLFINRLDSAENMIVKAERAGFSDKDKLLELKNQFSEFVAQELVSKIQINIVEGDFKDARKLLARLKDSKYQKTQAYKVIDTLEAQLQRAEENSKNVETDYSRDLSDGFAKALVGYEELLASGHEIYAKKFGGFSSVKSWEQIIKELDPNDDSGMINAMKKYELEQPEGLLRNRIKKMRDKASEILICAYKSIVSYYLMRVTSEAFKTAYEYLRKALIIAPLDRELLYYWYLYDEYRPLITSIPKADDNNQDEEDRK